MKKIITSVLVVALLFLITGTTIGAAEQASSAAESQKKAMEQAPSSAEPPKKAMEQAPSTAEPEKKAMEQAPSTAEPEKKAVEQAPSAAEPQKKAGTMPQSASPATATIQGQVLKIESDSLIVSTGGGGQARLKLDGNTKIQGSPKVGDKVEAELSPERNVLSLKVSQ
jgi:hypothetical protein